MGYAIFEYHVLGVVVFLDLGLLIVYNRYDFTFPMWLILMKISQYMVAVRY